MQMDFAQDDWGITPGNQILRVLRRALEIK